MLTELIQGNAHGEVLRSKTDTICLNEFVFALDEDIFTDVTAFSLPSPGRAWSCRLYYVDVTQSHRKGEEVLIQGIQTVCMRVIVWCQPPRTPAYVLHYSSFTPSLFRSRTLLCFPQQVLIPGSPKSLGNFRGLREFFFFASIDRE